MSIATWRVMFVHPDENFQASVELYETAKKLLGSIGWLGLEFPDEGVVWASFNPNEVSLPINARDGGKAGYVEFDYFLQRFEKPTVEEQRGTQRYCKSCGALVPTLVECSRCGVEEHAAEWKTGPALVLYTRSFEIGLTFNGGPDLCTEDDGAIETKLRTHLAGVLDELERLAGKSFVMKKYVSE